MLLFTHIRLAHGFSNHKKRLQAVQARLHAISILGEDGCKLVFYLWHFPIEVEGEEYTNKLWGCEQSTYFVEYAF